MKGVKSKKIPYIITDDEYKDLLRQQNTEKDKSKIIDRKLEDYKTVDISIVGFVIRVNK